MMEQRMYHGETLGEALIAMKSDLGEDAVLISHRKIKANGLKGVLGKEVVEVVGEVMPNWMKKERSAREDSLAPGRGERSRRADVTEGVGGLLGVNPWMDTSAAREREPRRPAGSGVSFMSDEIHLPPVGQEVVSHHEGGTYSRRPIFRTDAPISASYESGTTLPPHAVSAYQSRQSAVNAGQRAYRDQVQERTAREETISRPRVNEKERFSSDRLQKAAELVERGLKTPRPASQNQPQREKTRVNASPQPAFTREGEGVIRYEKKIALPVDKTEVPSPRIGQLEDSIESLRQQMSSMFEEVRRSLRVDYPGKLGEFYLALTEMGVSQNEATEFIQEVARQSHPDELNDEEIMRARLRHVIAQKIRVAPPLVSREAGPTILVAVGPTGVGKTTTLAKLGAKFMLDERRSIAYVTLDTYRIAAVDQLRRYAEILGAPFEEALTPGDLREAIELHSEKEFILVDTAGRSPRNDEHLKDLQEMLAASDIPLHVCLFLSADSREKDRQVILEKFKIANPSCMVVTKVDETDALGSVVSLMGQTELPLAYLTTGQNVPDDIEVADGRRIAARMLEK